MIDWISVKLNILSITGFFAALATKNNILFLLAAGASISTMLYNWYKWNKDKKSEK